MDRTHAQRRLSTAAAAACVAFLLAVPTRAAQGAPSVESAAQTGIAVESTDARQHFRIVSATPAITEIVYALGGGDRLVGIASYSDFPPRAKKEKPEVGGILNIDYEKILALKPDLILSPPGAMAAEKLTRLGIEVQFVPNKTLADIERSFEIIGAVVGKAAEGRALAERFAAAITAARERRREGTPTRALVVIGYEPLYVAGGWGFLNELLETAGGSNAAGKVRKDFYAADVEGVIAARPEVIIDLTLEDTRAADRRAVVLEFWKRFPSIPAVGSGRIEVIDSDFLTIPGPRLVDGLAALERALHPVRPDAVRPSPAAEGGR